MKIWGDNWIPAKNNPRIISPLIHGQSEARVSCLIDQHQRVWKEQVLIWPFTTDGEYSVKWGYKLLQDGVMQQTPGPSNSDTMKPLWKANLASQCPSQD